MPTSKQRDGVAFGKKIQTGPVRHRRGYSADLVIRGRVIQQGIGKDLGVAGRVGRGFLSARRSPHRTVLWRGRHLGRLRRGHSPCPFSLPRGSGSDPRHVAARCAEPAKADPYHGRRSDRHRKSKLFEQGAANGHTLEHFLGAPRAFLKRLGQKRHCALGGGLEFLKRFSGIKPRQIRRKRAHRGAIDISLSFRITISRRFRWPALFIASNAMPALMAPSTDDGDCVTMTGLAEAAQIAGHGKAKRCTGSRWSCVPHRTDHKATRIAW